MTSKDNMPEGGRPRPLFLVGSKRSGSTLLVNLLNVHSQVFVTHEADLAWILYQLFAGHSGPLERYVDDDAKGMMASLAECSEMLKPRDDLLGNRDKVREIFYNTLDYIRLRGRESWDRPKPSGAVKWVGDKKPVQQCDPDIRKFLHYTFPEAAYIHLIRHPRSAVASMMKAARTWGNEDVPPYWRRNAAEVLARWTTHEEWVLELKSEQPGRVHTIRLEDLAADPPTTIESILEFLELEAAQANGSMLRDWVWHDPNKDYRSFHLPPSDRADRILDIYGYSRD